MDVMFVYSLDNIQSTQKPLRSWAAIQFGISYISSVLKSHGHKTRLLVLGSNKLKESYKLLQSNIEDFDPDLICFTSVFSQYSFIEKIAKYIRSQWPDKFLIIGGVHATLNPEEVINGPFDALCVGEGEYPALELCSQLQEKHRPKGIANLWIKSCDGKIERNDPRAFFQNLDMLPFPDRDMWKPWMEEQLDTEFAVLLGRGCWHSCTYCSNHALKKVAGGRYVRMRSSENIIEELDFIKDNYQTNKIYFEVESIALNKDWALELCSKLEHFNNLIGNSISYGCNFRISPQSADEKLFMAFEKANFSKINIGLESGSERIRSKVLKRYYSNNDFINTVSVARKHGLRIIVYNMIGIPGETLADHMETVQLNRQCQPDGHFTGIFFPYPGTELFDICIKENLLQSPLVLRMERSVANIELPNFTKRQIKNALAWFDYRVYKGHKSFWVILHRTISILIRNNPTISFLYLNAVRVLFLRNLRALLPKLSKQ